MSFRIVPPASEFFYFSNEREDVFVASQTAVEYAKYNEISAVVFLDRTARPIWKGFKEYWQQTSTAEQPVPALFFVDPDGFRANYTRTVEQVSAQMESEHPYLIGHADKPVLLVDTCIHTGKSLRSVTRDLRDIGFDQLHIGVVSNDRNHSEIKPDITLLPWPPAKPCMPFGPDSLTDHTADSLHTVPADLATPGQPEMRNLSIQLRTEIGKIIHEGIKNGGEFPHRPYDGLGVSPEVAQAILDHLGIVTLEN